MTRLRPLIVGEVLFDRFPDGKRVLGGAPFNVAWNLQGLGMAPTFVSAIGDDDEGREIHARMEAWGLDTSALQISERGPTGQVRVELSQGQPSFHILDAQSYDDIRFPQFPISPADFSLLYVGSLAYRHEPSRSTLRRLIGESGLPRFVDVNIRRPWFDRGWLPDLFGQARWIKLSDQELSELAETECRSGGEIRAATDTLRARYGGQQFFVTRGADGACAVDEGGEVLYAAAPLSAPLADTVGAGDAFAAATIYGVLRERPLEEILRSAVEFASRACTIQGATTRDPAHYANLGTEH